MKLRASYIATVAIAAVVIAWFIYPVPFQPPPTLGELRVTEGYATLQSGKTHRNLVVGGVHLACGHTPTSGATVPCDGLVQFAGVKDAKAYWYPHPAKWPHSSTNMLMQLEVPPGNVVLTYESQVSRLAKAISSQSAHSK
jgi:hypothetical protein